MNTLNRCIARVLIVCTIGTGMPMSSFAAIVTTDQVQTAGERDTLRQFLERADARSRMQSLGVDPDATSARVEALSDEEAAALARDIDALPAGGHDIVGALLLVFIVLLITDILGYTKVFPFTRSAR